MAEKNTLLAQAQTDDIAKCSSEALKRSLVIISAFGLFFVVWYYNLGVRPFRSFLGGSETVYYLANYLVSGTIPAVAMWFLYRRWRVIFEQLGLARGFGTGALFAVVCTLPMFIGYAWIGTFDREFSMDRLLTRVVIAGFFEEIFFRGFVFGQLFRHARWGFVPAALLTAAAFGSLHLYQGHDPASAFGAFAVTALGSLFFSWIYVEWNFNLWTVVWLHTWMNLPWILFCVSDSGAVGGIGANTLRIGTIVLAIGATIIHKKRKALPYHITMKTLINNKLCATLVAAMLLCGCTSRQPADERTLYVSIQPLRSLVKGIVGDDFDVRVLVPAGASPETFEPTPRQFVDLNRAQMIFNVGLIDFETTLLGKIESKDKIVDLSRGIDLIAGSCSHGAHGRNDSHKEVKEDGHDTQNRQAGDAESENGAENVQGSTHGDTHGNESGNESPEEKSKGHANDCNACNEEGCKGGEPHPTGSQDCGHAAVETGHSHTHGVDPHVWTSPKALRQMAANAYDAIRRAYPDSVKYAANYERLHKRLAELDARTAEKIARSGVEYFIIYHPALTYYARDYGLRQVAIEEDGKEPSARRLTQLIRQAREDGVRRIFYQSQFPASTVEVIARDLRAQSVEIDPLAEDVIGNIDRITDQILSQ